MKRTFSLICLLPFLTLCSFHTYATEPWFTGPVLITPAEAMPLGTANWELYLQNSNTNGYYNYDFSFTSIPLVTIKTALSKFTYGLASDVDFEIDTLYQDNATQGTSSNNIGDTLMILGLQVLKQGDSHTRPNLKITLQELFPTGQFDQLTPGLFATDATGGGSYQTSVAFNFSFLAQLSEDHYVKTSASVTVTQPNPVHLHGQSIYGGTDTTDGQLKPGTAIAFDLAAEYTLTQQWVAVLEGYFLAQKSSVFNGFIGVDPNNNDTVNPATQTQRQTLGIVSHRIRPTKYNIGNPEAIGNGNMAEIELVPAVEYNFSKNIGLIGSVGFTVIGKNTPEFFNGLLALNIIF